jgi:hypothetical protein
VPGMPLASSWPSQPWPGRPVQWNTFACVAEMQAVVCTKTTRCFILGTPGNGHQRARLLVARRRGVHARLHEFDRTRVPERHRAAAIPSVARDQRSDVGNAARADRGSASLASERCGQSIDLRRAQDQRAEVGGPRPPSYAVPPPIGRRRNCRPRRTSPDPGRRQREAVPGFRIECSRLVLGWIDVRIIAARSAYDHQQNSSGARGVCQNTGRLDRGPAVDVPRLRRLPGRQTRNTACNRKTCSK